MMINSQSCNYYSAIGEIYIHVSFNFKLTSIYFNQYLFCTEGESGGAIGEGPGPSVSTLAPTTPRIDISRASSSSHHDSNSSPERELFTG